MTNQATARHQQVDQSSHRDDFALGFALFAGLMMIMAGTFQAIAGLVGLFENEFYVVTRSYVLEFDVTAWGWIHLIVGVLVLVAGIGVIRGQTWARAVGIILAGLSALANFAFIPYYPIWSLLIITLDVVVIWALTAYVRKS